MAGIAGQSKLAGIFRYLTERYGETHPWNIELVRSRLEVTQENITSDCGFSNPNYLKNLFKKTLLYDNERIPPRRLIIKK